MNSQTQEEQQPTEHTAVSFGEQIRQAREAREMSIDDLVGETRIHPQHLIDIEQGKTSGISATGYVVGYLRTLAKILDLDAEQLVTDYEQSLTQSDQQIIDPDHELLPPPRKKNSGVWIVVVVITFLVVAALGTVGYFWWDSMNSGPSNTPLDETEIDEQVNVSEVDESFTQPPQSLTSAVSTRTPDPSLANESEESPPTVAARLNGDDSESVETNSTDNLADTAQSTEPSTGDWTDLMNLTQNVPGSSSNENVAESDDSSDENPTVPGDESDREIDGVENSTLLQEEQEVNPEVAAEVKPLVFEFSDISYIEVTDADDNQLVSETKQAGTKLVLDVEGKEPYTVKLGYAPGVTVFFHGEKIDLNQHTRRNIAEFTLPQ